MRPCRASQRRISAITLERFCTPAGGRATDHRDGNRPVESVGYPILPHVPPPPNAAKLELWGMNYSQASRASLWSDFTANAGYWGVDYPTFVRSRIDSRFAFLTDGERHALYIDHHDRDRA